MCLVSTPKIKDDGVASSKKDLPILRNPLLDGMIGSIRSLQMGRGALRIDRIRDPITGVTSAAPGGTMVSAPGAGAAYAGSPLPAYTGPLGIGGGGGSSGGRSGMSLVSSL